MNTHFKNLSIIFIFCSFNFQVCSFNIFKINGNNNAKIMLSILSSFSVDLITNHHDISFAAQGPAPKLEYFKFEDQESKGTKVYNEADENVIKLKLSVIDSNWKKMIKKVESSILKNNKQESLSVMSNYMGQLKSDIRLVSKVACDGDILVRERIGLSGEKEANFNYNTGQFQLKMIAQKAEDIINTINDLYFNGNNNEISINLLTKAKDSYNIWYNLVK